MKTKQIRKPAKLAALLVSVAMLGLVSQSALAALAGSTISNLATLDYTVTVGGLPVAQTPIGSSAAGNTSGAGTATTFTVDAKVNMLVTADNVAALTSVVPGQIKAATPFTLTNTGNATVGYNLAAANLAPAAYTVGGLPVTDIFDTVAAPAIYLDVNNDGLWDAGDTLVTSIATVAPGGAVNLIVVGDVPATPVNGNHAVVSLTATAVWPTPLVATETPGNLANGVAIVAGGAITNGGINNAGVDVVLADVAGAADAAGAANHSAYAALKVVSAGISVAKTATVLCDPVNGTTNPKNIPGAIVQWTITVSNSATAGASANLTSIADALDVTNTTFDLGTATGPTIGSATCAAGAGTNGFKIVSSAGGRALGGVAGVMSNAGPAIGGDGAAFITPNVTIDFPVALPAGGAYTAGELKPGESATVTFDVLIN